MTLELLHLWPLAALPLWLWLYRQERRSAAPLSPRSRAWAFGLRTALLLLLVLALCEPRLLRERRETFVHFLMDVSRSLGGTAAREKAHAFAAEAVRSGTIKEHAFLSFAGRPALESTPPQDPAVLEDDGTDLAAALRFAQAATPPGFAKAAILFSDGQETRGEVASLLPELKRAGVRVDVVPLSPPEKPEVLVRRVSAPREVNAEEPFKVVAEVYSNRETPAKLSLFRNGARVAEREVALRVGNNRFETTQSAGEEALSEFSASIRAAEDTLADNNHAATFVHSQGRSKALLLTDKPEAARHLARALRQEGVLLDIRPALGAPGDLADLQNYDLLLFDNLPATSLTPAQMALYATWVRDFGGGFLMLGGENAFGLGGYFRTPVEELLPVRCDFEKEEETPALGLLLVIDRSGSMNGEKMELAKDAAKAAVELLSDRDYAGVIAFDNEAYWVSELQSTLGKGTILSQISTIEANGGTNLAPALEQALEALRNSPAKIKHIIALTDGMSQPGPFEEIAGQIAAHNITLSTVGVGEGADQTLLQMLASRGNGRYYFTDQPHNVPQIFTRETMSASKSALKEAPFLPVAALPAPFLSGVELGNAPFLLGFVNTRPKPTAEVWLVTETGEPLLATWRYGLGQAGAFTSDARNRWAVEWLGWEGYGKFWAQTARQLMRTGALRHLPLALERKGESFVCTVDAVDAQGRFRSGVRGELQLVDAAGQTRKLPLALEAPGRLAARWPATAEPLHAQAILYDEAGEVLDRQFLTAAAGYSEEFLPRGVNEPLLRQLARETGGIYAPATFTDTRSAPVESELWPWLAALALAAFLADVAVRRWPQP